MKNSIFIAQESSQYLGLKNYIPLLNRGLTKKSDIHQNRFFNFFNLWSFHSGVSSKKHFEHSSKLISSHFSIYSSLSFILIYHIFGSYYYFPPWARTLVVYAKLIDQNYPIQQSRNLVYHHWILINHLQVIPHEHLSRIDLMINKLLPTRTRTTYQIQMTASHV